MGDLIGRVGNDIGQILPRTSCSATPSRFSTARLPARTTPLPDNSSIGSGSGSAKVRNCSGVTVEPLPLEILTALCGFRLRRRLEIDDDPTARIALGDGLLDDDLCVA